MPNYQRFYVGSRLKYEPQKIISLSVSTTKGCSYSNVMQSYYYSFYRQKTGAWEEAGKLAWSDSLLVQELSKDLLRSERIKSTSDKMEHAKWDMSVGSDGCYI